MLNTGSDKRRLSDIYTVCRAILSPGLWAELTGACKGPSDPESFVDALRLRLGEDGIPAYISELARLEFIADRTGFLEVPVDVDKLCLNPTVQLIELSWKNLLPMLFSGGKAGAPSPEPGDELVIAWNDPGTSRTQISVASDDDLLALKIVVEELDPADAAARGNVRPRIVHAAIDDAVRKGILLFPPSRIQRRFRHAREKAPDQSFLSAGTFTLQWHVTQDCDLHCKHCYDRSERAPLPIEKARKILDDLREFCRIKRTRGHISFSGGNPLLYPYLTELYREAAGCGFTLAIIGNPSPAVRIQELAEIDKPAFFQVSIEGLEEQDDDVRGPGHFARTIEFLKVLRDLDIYSMVMLTLTRDNIDDVLPLCEFLRDKADLFSFSRLSMTGEGAKLRLPSPPEYSSFIGKYIRASEQNPVMSFKDNLINIVLHRERQELFGGCTGYGCGAAFNFVSVLADGEVHACRKFPSLIGNIFQGSLAEIYDSAPAQRYRAGCEACAPCEIRHVCGGCLAVAGSHGLNIFGEPDPYCFMKEERAI